MNVYSIVKDVIEQHTEAFNYFNEDSSLDRLGLDSLDIVEITSILEDEFEIEFTSEEITNLKTIRDIVSLIEQKTK